MSARSRLIAAAALVAIAAPALLAFRFVLVNGSVALSWDDWERVPLYASYLRGEVTLTTLFAQHNEHRIFLGRMLILISDSLSSMDSRPLLWMSLLCLSLSAAVLFLDFRGQSPRPLLAFAPVAWLVFSLRQAENLLWGWQMQLCLCALFAVVALHLLAQRRPPAFAILAGLGASFSFFSGLLIWPAGALQIALDPRDRPRRLTWWCGSGALTLALYFRGWVHPDSHPSLLSVLRAPLQGLTYFLACVGNPLAIDPWSAVGMGAALLGLYFAASYLFLRGPRRPTLAPGLLVFSLATSATLAVGRSGFGIEQALASRYTTFTLLGVVALYLLLLNLEGRLRDALLGACLALCAAGGFVAWRGGTLAGNVARRARAEQAQILRAWRTEPDEAFVAIYPSAARVRGDAAFLETHELNVFKQRLH